ncbi:MAG TPA: hypothetical protein DCZ11_01945 [Gammaproteobacteria bacterium]|nr:hypothetical protein [Gammaproteobacteria bacterium]MCH77186.1 hypothetical protein [Gammaproteobacteria bacterium]
MTPHCASTLVTGQRAPTTTWPEQQPLENRLSSHRDSAHPWQILVLDLSTPGSDSLTSRLVAPGDVGVEFHTVADAHQFHQALASGPFDLAILAAPSAEAARGALDRDPTPIAVPLLMVLDEIPPTPPSGPDNLPLVGVCAREALTANDLLTALGRSRATVAFAANPDGVVMLDADGRVEVANAAATRLLGGSAREIRGLPLDLRVDDNGLPLLTTPDGRVLEWRRQPVGHPAAGAVVTLRDVTERHAAARVLAFRAEHDTLTGLANLVRMKAELRAAIARAERDGGRLAVLYLDLDGFKEVNDTYGHEVGDALLQAVSQRLTGVCRAGELLARVGGDELVMLAESFPPGFEGRIAERVLESLDSPLQAAERSLRLGLSIGIAVYPDHASDPDGLLRAADEAMYEAKRSGGGAYRLATSHIDAVSQRRQEIADGLQEGLLRGEFELLYQPLLDLKRGRFTGAEALIRWHRPGVGVVHPHEFLDVAETSGLILGIGDWVLDHICQQLAQWRWTLGEDFFIGANLSALQLRRSDFAGRFRRVLHSHGLSSEAVHLEVSENIVAQELGRALADVTASSDMFLAVDDVSQGLLSLRNISNLPIRSMKLDHGLIAGLPHDPLSVQLVEALISIGRTFGVSVVAEGVETAAQLQFLRQHGCDFCQGFLLSAPVSSSELPVLVNTPELVSGLMPLLS